jgi:hypothetical protein
MSIPDINILYSKVIKINKWSIVAQYKAYNDLKAFSPLCLAHYQAHYQWVWQQERPMHTWT